MKRCSKEAGAVAGMWLSMLLLTGTAARSDNAVETIIFVRHGEKPHNGLGQINCQGLNRALALPSVIAKTFGKPDAIFVPDPDEQVTEDGRQFHYVRPLATIEPTAILFELPINASISASDTDRLRTALEQPEYSNARVLVAWEHWGITVTVRALLARHGADAAVVPHWDRHDYDSIYVVTITSIGATREATFAIMHQGLDGQKETCPQ